MSIALHPAPVLAAIAVAAGALSALVSCEGSDSADTLAVRIDSISSATPGVLSAILTDAHPGWGQAGCFGQGCHAPAHGSKSRAGCTVCHGDNGAPRMTSRAAHDLAVSCSNCHGAVHQDLGFDDPVDCTTCHKFAAGDTCPVWREVDVAVIGAGGGGLSAAAALARAGKKVAVLDKHNKVGGYMTAFERKGYRLEVSLHGFDGLSTDGMNVPVFKQLGILDRVKPVKTSIMYKTIYPDFSFEVPENIDAYEAKLKQVFPDQAEGIARVFGESKFLEYLLIARTKAHAGEGPMPSQEDLEKFQRYDETSLTHFLAQHLSDQKPITLYTQLAGLAGAEPNNLSAGFFVTMWNSYHRHGFHFFEGGSQSVSDAMADVVRENGGTIRLGTLATKVAFAGGAVTHVETKDDACYRAQYVVSNAPAPLLIRDLVGTEHVAEADVKKYDSWKVGLSAFVIYLGVDYDYREVFGDTYEIMITDSYDPAQNFATVAACDVEKTPFAVANYTVVDPTDAPAGKNVIEIPAQLGYDCGQQRYRDKSFEEYKPYKEEMGMATVRRAEALLPGLRDHIEVFEVGMPRTMHGFTFNPRGTIFGWDSVISQTMMSRMGADRLGASTTCTLQAPGASLAEGNPPSFSPAPGRRPRFSLSSPDRGTRQDELCPPRTSPATDQPGSIAMADGLATTSLVLGEREALSMLERTPDVEGLLLVEEEGRGRRLMGTNGFDAKILHEV